MSHQDREFEKDILLHAHKCGSDLIHSFLRIGYDVGFAIITAIVLIIGYSLSTKHEVLLAFIPFILFIVAVIHYHVTMTTIELAKYMLQIEKKINALVNGEQLDIELEIGYYNKNVSLSPHKILIPITFIFCYIVLNCIYVVIYVMQNKTYAPIFLALYIVLSFIISVILLIFLYRGLKEVRKLYEDTHTLSTEA